MPQHTVRSMSRFRRLRNDHGHTSLLPSLLLAPFCLFLFFFPFIFPSLLCHSPTQKGAGMSRIIHTYTMTRIVNENIATSFSSFRLFSPFFFPQLNNNISSVFWFLSEGRKSDPVIFQPWSKQKHFIAFTSIRYFSEIFWGLFFILIMNLFGWLSIIYETKL